MFHVLYEKMLLFCTDYDAIDHVGMGFMIQRSFSLVIWWWFQLRCVCSLEIVHCSASWYFYHLWQRWLGKSRHDSTRCVKRRMILTLRMEIHVHAVPMRTNVNLGDSGTKPPCKLWLIARNSASVKDPPMAPRGNKVTCLKTVRAKLGWVIQLRVPLCKFKWKRKRMAEHAALDSVFTASPYLMCTLGSQPIWLGVLPLFVGYVSRTWFCIPRSLAERP